MRKTNKIKYANLLLAFCMAAILASCGAAPAGFGQVSAAEPVAVPSVSSGADRLEAQNQKLDGAVKTSLDKTDPQPVDKKKYNPFRFIKDNYADRRTAKALSGVAGLQSNPEKYNSSCVVDMRGGKAAYDVDWDYGADYQEQVSLCDWSKVFDVEYYMDTFPMLALQASIYPLTIETG